MSEKTVWDNWQSDPERLTSFPKQLREAAMNETDTRKAQGMRDIADAMQEAFHELVRAQSLDAMTVVTALAARGWFLFVKRTPLDGGGSGGHLPIPVENERKAA